jgi:broad specificity phosphatase PhoE
MILYFVRHGQTDFNKTHRLQGLEFNEPLNALGEKEMQDLLPNLPTDFEVIFASPLKRVQMSAEIIAHHFHKPIITKEEITERDFGSLAGKTWDDIPNGRKLQTIDRKQEYDYRPYGGESVDDVIARLKHFLDYAKTPGYQSALVVSSIGILRLVYKILLDENVIEIKNASVHRFEI